MTLNPSATPASKSTSTAPLPKAAKAPEVHHQLASEHHEIASKLHKDAATQITAGDHKTAAHSAMLAHGHTVHATEHGNEASKQQATASLTAPAKK